MEGVQGKIQGPGDEFPGREEKEGQVWYRYLLQVVPVPFTAVPVPISRPGTGSDSSKHFKYFQIQIYRTGLLVNLYYSLGLCC
jgi:hypothetical protein